VAGKRRAVVKAPASIANFGPGFDIVAAAIEGFYDIVEVSLSPGTGRVFVESYGFNVPSGEGNVAYHVAKSFLDKLSVREYDVYVTVKKGIPPSRGLGSSGATSIATAQALNTLLNTNLDEKELLYLAGIGEAFTAGSPHYDNVSASLLGGFVILDLTRGIILRHIPRKKIPIALIIPETIQVVYKKTAYARSLLPSQINLDTHVKQSSSLAKLIYGILTEDLKVLGEAASTDYIVEPSRAKMIPFYNDIKKIALDEGAYGVNISGAGPSIFILHEDVEKLVEIGEKIKNHLFKLGVKVNVHISFISQKGAELIEVE
jgi:homoserine kinase